MNLHLEILFLSFITGFIVHVSAELPVEKNLKCYECNTYRGSTLNTCNQLQAKPEKGSCKACMKVHTRMEMHDYWNKPRVVTFESFTCVAKDFSVKPDGCYLTTGSRSLTKVCYCSTDLCNSAGRRHVNRTLLVVVVLFSLLMSVKGLCPSVL